MNARLLDEVNHLQTSKITTYEDGKYTDDVRICVMELLLRNVGIKQVESVIRAVMKMCKVKCDRLPQHTAIDDNYANRKLISVPDSACRSTYRFYL